MQFGFIKVCAATPDMRVADIEFNTCEIIKKIKESAEKGSRLTVFPELCVCGYTCGDLFGQDVLLKSIRTAIEKICLASAGIKTLVFIGAPFENGGRLYNCAIAISDGRILGIIPKTYIPNYREFYEKRYFSPAPSETTQIEMSLNGKKLLINFGCKQIFKAADCPQFTVAAEICEDLWAPESPSVKSVNAGANIIVNLSCSNETVGKAEYRRNLVKVQSAKLICGYIYCDAGEGESSTDMTFGGHNIVAENGSILVESKLFENGLIYSEIDVEKLASERRRLLGRNVEENKNDGFEFVSFDISKTPFKFSRTFSKTPFVPDGGLAERSELILTIQQKALEKRFKHTGSQTAVLGISGGLDSTLALLVTVRAFKSLNKDLKNIIAVTMPGFGTSDKTKNNSLKLIESLGVSSEIIPIGDCVNKHFEDIGHDKNYKNVTYENAQARMRTLVLMDIANERCGLVVGTGDLSELALGWATYNGDHMSMYGVNASVPKTLVKHLVKYEADKIGGECEKVLKDILNTEISPELLPPDKNGKIAQKTEELVGPYVLHDFFLYYAIRWSFAPKKVLFLATKAFKGDYDEATIKKWLKVFYKRFFAHQFKRSCMPDGVKVGSVSLSPRGDWRMPSDAISEVWLNELN